MLEHWTFSCFCRWLLVERPRRRWSRNCCALMKL